VSWIESSRLAGIQLSLIRRVMQSAPEGAINLALGELGFPMPLGLKEIANKLLLDGNPCYTPNAGLPETREAIAKTYSQTSANQVCVCNGAEEALYIALSALVNKDDIIAIPDPDYPAYPSLCSMFGANVVRLPVINYFKDIDWVKWELILKSGVKAVLLSSPSNPSGFTFNEGEAERFGALCNRYGIIVVIDEIYASLYFDEAPICLQGSVEHLIRIGGVSKSHCLSGWRIGWIIAPEEIITSMIKAKQYISTCSHWLSQKLTVEALSEPAIAASIRQLLNTKLPPFATAAHVPEATPYIMLKNQNPDDLDVARQLANAGVITVPGRAFGDSGKGWIRLNIGVELPLLERATAILYQQN